MNNNDLISFILRMISLFAPILIAILLLLLHFDKLQIIITSAFGNGSLLTPMGIVILGILARKWHDWSPRFLLGMGLAGFTVFILHGMILENSVSKSIPPSYLIWAIIIVYIVIVFIEGNDDTTINLGPNN